MTTQPPPLFGVGVSPHPNGNSTAPIHVDAEQKPSLRLELGPYFLHHVIGQGAMGQVYEATHNKLKRKVALKILPAEFSENPSRLARFQREMEAVGRLDHANIIRATDAGEAEGVHYLAMELIHGSDVNAMMKGEGQLATGAICEIVRQTAVGLQHVQQHGLVHRDIKPSNLMVTTDGVVKILDLGIARIRRDDQVGTLTSESGLMGTPDFVAPEQVLETGCVDIRADIYSLGCTLYRLLSGRLPFEGPSYGTQMAKVLAHTQDTPQDLHELRPDLSDELISLTEKMMAKRPEDRFHTPNDVATALQPWSDGSGLTKSVAKHLNQPVPITTAPPQLATRTTYSSTQSKAHGAASPLPRQRSVWPWIAVASVAGIVLLGINAKFRADRAATTAASASSIERLADNSDQINQATQDFAATGNEINRNTQRIAETLDDLRNAFQAASLQGGLVAEPASAGEIYHNARIHVQQGKNLPARQSYQRLIESGTPFVDIHKSFMSFLVAQEGTPRAKAFYHQHGGQFTDTSVYQWAAACLAEPEEKRAQLAELLDRDPDFAPAVYELSKTLATNGNQTLSEQAQELALLQKFQQLHRDGQVLCHYLDQSEAAAAIDDVQRRIDASNSLSQTVLDRPVQATLTKHNHGWSVVIQVAEPTREIFYCTESEVEFRSTGFTSGIDTRTGFPRPRITVSLPPKSPPREFVVKYRDARGKEQGPYTIRFDAHKAAIRSAKRMLDFAKHSWLQFSNNKLFFTMLAAHEGAITEVRYGLNKKEPDQVHALPDLKAGRSSGYFVTVSPSVKFAVVQLTFVDGTKSEVVRIDR